MKYKNEYEAMIYNSCTHARKTIYMISLMFSVGAIIMSHVATAISDIIVVIELAREIISLVKFLVKSLVVLYYYIPFYFSG